MPGPTLLMHAASWSQALPPAALSARRGWRVPGRKWAALANVVYVVGDLLRLFLSAQWLNNLWVGYVVMPLGGALLLLALSSWQPTRRARTGVLRLIPVYLVVWGVLLIGEDLSAHSVLALPFDSLLLLGASLWTLGACALADRSIPILRSDWFWVATGIALRMGAASTTGPLLRQLIAGGENALAFTVVEVKAGFDLAAAILITVGMLCPVPPAPSGRSSSPAR